jgi:hypothetical protein
MILKSFTADRDASGGPVSPDGNPGRVSNVASQLSILFKTPAYFFHHISIVFFVYTFVFIYVFISSDRSKSPELF